MFRLEPGPTDLPRRELTPRVAQFFKNANVQPFREGNYDWLEATVTTSEFGRLRVSARTDGAKIAIDILRGAPPVEFNLKNYADTTVPLNVLFDAAERAVVAGR